jgi:hypothetical protein
MHNQSEVPLTDSRATPERRVDSKCVCCRGLAVYGVTYCPEAVKAYGEARWNKYRLDEARNGMYGTGDG